jgi:hypothetical protein
VAASSEVDLMPDELQQTDAPAAKKTAARKPSARAGLSPCAECKENRRELVGRILRLDAQVDQLDAGRSELREAVNVLAMAVGGTMLILAFVIWRLPVDDGR